MPNKEFLEEYPLYRKMKLEHPDRLDNLPKVNINMHCPTCTSNQTFIMKNEYWENAGYMNAPSQNMGLRLLYLCSHCESFERLFFVKFSPSRENWLMKIGQYPAWEIVGNPNIERLLGNHAAYFKRGLVCESQGYGIGAFSYYRRIVEEIIDGLLDEIAGLLSGSDFNAYQEALEKTKRTIVTADKIVLVKDLLPPILRPEGMNPLSALHSALSQGLHAESDESCLELAEHCRETLVFLVNQVAASKESAKTFTSSMRKLLEKKTEKSS